MEVSRYRHAVFIALLALVASMLSIGPSFAASDCPDGQTQFKIDSRPSDGTYGDGTLTVTISDAGEDSLRWSSNIEVTSVMVKAGPTLKSNPGGRSGTASSAQNPNNDQPYGISHVSFCYSVDDEQNEEETEEDDCVERNGGKECDEDDCPEMGNGKGKGKGNVECDEDDEEKECPEDASAGGSDMGKDCEETLADVDEKPAQPDDREAPNNGGRVDSGAKPAPSADVRGIRFADRGADSVSADARAQVQGAQERGRALPFTGAALLSYILLGLGLVGSGTLLWRRRHS